MLQHSEPAKERHKAYLGISVGLKKDKTNCTYCDYSNLDEIELKRHYRDEHKETDKSPSTSPPKKNLKNHMWWYKN